MQMFEQALQKNARLEDKLARSADALSALTQQAAPNPTVAFVDRHFHTNFFFNTVQVERSEATILQLESQVKHSPQKVGKHTHGSLLLS